VVEFICVGGQGGEAKVTVQLRTEFPGLGATILTTEGVAAAWRQEFEPEPMIGHKLFLTHTVIKKCEDYWYRTGEYKFSHIPRPLGSVSRQDQNPPCEAYIYEWVFGSSGFAWEYPRMEGSAGAIMLHDWNNFTTVFNDIGIDAGYDVVDADGGCSQNIVHQFPSLIEGTDEMCCLWKRIDFGRSSINIDWDKVSEFLHNKKKRLINVLRAERYEMLLLAVKYLTDRQHMSGPEIGRLEVLVGDYRRSSLSHYAMGLGPTLKKPIFGPITESLI